MKAFSIKFLKHGRKCDTLQEQSKVLEGAERILPRKGRKQVECVVICRGNGAYCTPRRKKTSGIRGKMLGKGAYCTPERKKASGMRGKMLGNGAYFTPEWKKVSGCVVKHIWVWSIARYSGKELHEYI